jgi:hypothetical protein
MRQMRCETDETDEMGVVRCDVRLVRQMRCETDESDEMGVVRQMRWVW